MLGIPKLLCSIGTHDFIEANHFWCYQPLEDGTRQSVLSYEGYQCSRCGKRKLEKYLYAPEGWWHGPTTTKQALEWLHNEKPRPELKVMKLEKQENHVE